MNVFLSNKTYSLNLILIQALRKGEVSMTKDDWKSKKHLTCSRILSRKLYFQSYMAKHSCFQVNSKCKTGYNDAFYNKWNKLSPKCVKKKTNRNNESKIGISLTSVLKSVYSSSHFQFFEQLRVFEFPTFQRKPMKNLQKICARELQRLAVELTFSKENKTNLLLINIPQKNLTYCWKACCKTGRMS